MKITSTTAPEAVHFDSGPARGVTGRVVIGQADGAGNFCMRRFDLAPGGHTPRHTHGWEHEIFFHAGRGEVFRAGEWVPVGPGDAVFRIRSIDITGVINNISGSHFQYALQSSSTELSDN